MTNTAELPPPLAIYRMVTGYYISRSLHVAATLGVADLMAEGPRAAEDLAAATNTHAPSLRRVLRLLASAGVFTEEEDGRFALTPIGQSLRQGVPGSMRGVAMLFGGRTQDVWAELMHAVKTGEPAFGRAKGADPFKSMAGEPEQAAIFDEAMADWTRQVAAASARAYDFSRFGTIVDVGGGNGTLLAEILKATRGPRGIVFELPHVVERTRANLAAEGLAGRCDAVAGDFFREVPASADAYVLKHVIHDWNDERAGEILKTVRRAMKPDARLLVIEGVYPPRADQSAASLGAASNDVNMLVCTGGRQRSEPEFRALYGAAGFELIRFVSTPPVQTRIIEGAPRP